MNKTKFAAKWLLATGAATALLLGSASVPAQAADTGWGKPIVSAKDDGPTKRDTGWGKP